MFNRLESKLYQTRLTVEDHGERLSSLELAAEDLSQQVLELEGACAALLCRRITLNSSLK